MMFFASTFSKTRNLKKYNIGCPLKITNRANIGPQAVLSIPHSTHHGIKV